MRKDVNLIIEFEDGEITEKDKIETFNSIMDFSIDKIANENAKQTIKNLKAFACLPIKKHCVFATLKHHHGTSGGLARGNNKKVKSRICFDNFRHAIKGKIKRA